MLFNMKLNDQYVKTFSVRFLAGLISLCIATATAASQVHVIDDGMHHSVDQHTPDDVYDVENGSSLDIKDGGIAGHSSDDNLIGENARVNVEGGGLLTGLWTVDTYGKLQVSGTGKAARLNGGVVLDGGGEVSLDNALVDSSYDTTFLLEGGTLNTTTHTIINADSTAIETHADFINNTININGSRITAGRYGVYLNGTGTTLTLNRADITGGRTALYIGDTENVIQIHGGSLISTGKVPLANPPGHDVKSGGVIVDLFTQNNDTRENTAVTVDSGTLVEDKALDGAGIFIINDDGRPVSGTITDSIVHGGKYGVYTTTRQDAPGKAGVSTLTLDHSRVSGDSGSAIRVDSGTTLNATLKNGAQLTGGNNTLASVGKGSQLNLSVDNSSLTGNLVNNEGGTENVTLNRGGMLTGMMQNVTALKMAEGAVWALTGNSSVGNLSNSGLISLAHGTAAGNTLTVTGNYTGNDGNLLFNTALGDDKSVTDKLLIKGNAAGTTNVSITNAGGTGAKTIDGIEIIHVDGTSTTDAFKQKGRIVAGAYDYTLKHRGNSWYLDSHNTDPGPGPDPKPTPDSHVVRPEAGAYIANQAASSMFLTTLHERAGENRYMNAFDAEGNMTSLWLRQVGNHNQFHDNSGQLKTTGNTYVAQLGGDLAQWSSTDHDRFHLGLMAGYGNNKNNTRSSVSGHNSKGSVTGYSAGLYGTWYQNDADKTGAYVDGQLMYSWFNNHVNGDAIAAESYKSKGLTASVETGYPLAMGQFGAADNPTGVFIEPQAQVTWMGVKADDLTESNGTHISIQGDNNIQTRLGVRAFMQGHNRIDNGKSRSFQPFVEVNWLHNTKRNGVTMNDMSLEQAGATNISEVKLGLEGQLTKRTALWGNVGQQVGDKGYSSTTAMAGVKYRF